MEIELLWLAAAAAGGLFGAAVGALQAFVLTGVAVLVGVAVILAGGDSTFLDYVGFGPVFGPHISFAGGVAAAAYAARTRTLEAGKDIVTPLVSLSRPDVLLVGAVFGVLGYLVNGAVAAIPWFGGNTDTVAVTVVVSAIIARLVFGRSGLPGTVPAGGTRFVPTDDHAWVRYQEKFGQNTVLGLFAGGVGAGATVALTNAYPEAAGIAQVVLFGVSALSLLFLSVGLSVPVTHHMTLPGGVAAATFLPVVDGNALAAVVIGAVAGMVGAWLAELFSRFWQIHGDTHIDPPASAIWPATTLVLVAGSLVG